MYVFPGPHRTGLRDGDTLSIARGQLASASNCAVAIAAHRVD